MRQMMEAQGVPQETIDETMALYEQLYGGSMEDAFAQLGIDASAFPKVEDADGVAFPKLEDPGGDAFMKLVLDENVLESLGGALPVAAAALSQAVADGDLDQATLEAILKLLP
jgi:hypothetical protein